MAKQKDEFRHSIKIPPSTDSEPSDKRKIFEVNHFRQYDVAVEIINRALEEGTFKLRVSTILSLHREAYLGITPYAGAFRPGEVAIQGSNLRPPSPWLVPELMEEMCDYVNDNWNTKAPLNLSAYTMWRLNWIHPFEEGNGTTARIISYVVLCIRLGLILPGIPTIPDLIADNRKPYFNALDAADMAFREERIDVSLMEELLSALLAKQLASFYESDGGKLPE